MASDYRYRFTLRARDDLDEIVRYMTGSLANPAAAAAFLDRVQAVIDEVRRFPESGPAVENEFLPGVTVRKKLAGHYVLYYLPDAETETITILRILYARRDLNEIIRSLEP